MYWLEIRICICCSWHWSCEQIIHYYPSPTAQVMWSMQLICLSVNSTTEVYKQIHYYDVIMGGIASQITSLTIVYSIVYSDADQRKHQSSASLAFVRWIHRGPVNSPHKWSVTRKMFPLHDVIMFHERSVTGRTLYKDQSVTCGRSISGYRIFCCFIFSIVFFREWGSVRILRNNVWM